MCSLRLASLHPIISHLSRYAQKNSQKHNRPNYPPQKIKDLVQILSYDVQNGLMSWYEAPPVSVLASVAVCEDVISARPPCGV